MGLTVETRVLGEIAVVHLAGKLVFRDEARALSEHVVELLDRRLSVVLNLEEVTTIDGGGLGVLVASSKRAETRGLALKICNLDARLREVFAITNLYQVLDVHEHEEAALESFGARAA
ncbi:MAG TPA: STAS domain-containing protein [Terriglobales bacterium]|nr:STAS domain-containing protein [Terriglobales bacterium]